MSVYKRKRSYSGAASALVLARPYSTPYKRKKASHGRAFIPGRDRVGGYYGRYAHKGGELKFHDVDLDDPVVATGGVVTASVNLIAQGVGESQRVGRKCTIKSIQWRYRSLVPEVDAAADPAALEALRIIMYVDKQANGATAAVTDLYESGDLHAFRNLSNTSRFTILCDKIVELNYMTLASDSANVVSQGTVSYEGVFYKKCNIPLEFDAATGAITEIRSNNIGVLIISNSGIGGFNSKIRLRFSDGS